MSFSKHLLLCLFVNKINSVSASGSHGCFYPYDCQFAGCNPVTNHANKIWSSLCSSGTCYHRYNETLCSNVANGGQIPGGKNVLQEDAWCSDNQWLDSECPPVSQDSNSPPVGSAESVGAMPGKKMNITIIGLED